MTRTAHSGTDGSCDQLERLVQPVIDSSEGYPMSAYQDVGAFPSGVPKLPPAFLTQELLFNRCQRFRKDSAQDVMGDLTSGLQFGESVHFQRAAQEVDTLDVLINNAGIALYDDLSNSGAIEQSLAVNLFGAFHVTCTFLPLLQKSNGTIVNNLSLMALAPLPMTSAYAISKAAALSMTQSLRALLAGRGVTVHLVFLGPVDTDMTRGFEIPKASPESVAAGIFDGLENGEEDIFPDPASQSIAEGWRTGIAKAFERQHAGFLPESAAV